MAPENFRCSALSSTTLQITWQPPPLNHQNGLLQGYKVTFEPMADDYMQGKKSFLILFIMTKCFLNQLITLHYRTR